MRRSGSNNRLSTATQTRIRRHSAGSHGTTLTRYLYLDLYVNAPVAYVALDPAGRIELVNHAAVDLLGDTARRLAGRAFETFVYPGDVDTWRRHIGQAKAIHRPVANDVTLRIGDKLRVIHAASTHLADDGERTMSALVDVTTRQLSTKPSRSSTPSERAHPPSILLVEDDSDLRELTALMLRRLDYEVHSVGTVADALDKASRLPFDVLVSDLGLPDGSGLELLRDLKSRNANLKAIAISGQADASESLRAGFVAHLKKPLEFPELRSCLREVL